MLVSQGNLENQNEIQNYELYQHCTNYYICYLSILSFFIEGKLLLNHDLLEYCKHSPDDQMPFIPKIQIILNACQVVKQVQAFYY